MAKEETRYFWTKVGETFAGLSFGADVTDHFKNDVDGKGKVIKGSRLDKMISLGQISDEQPQTFEAAENGELVGLRKTVELQKIEITDLKNQLKQSPKSVRSAKKRIDELENFIAEKDAQIAELTAPSRGGK